MRQSTKRDSSYYRFHLLLEEDRRCNGMRRALTAASTIQKFPHYSVHRLSFLVIQSQIVAETELAYLHQIVVLQDSAGAGDRGVVDPGTAV